MENSLVHGRIYFLNELRDTSITTRKTMIEYINVYQMKALERVIRFILNGSINILERDLETFSRYVYLLRQIISQSVSLRRKRDNLLIHHGILPRVLRSYYLNQAIILEIQSVEQ